MFSKKTGEMGIEPLFHHMIRAVKIFKIAGGMMVKFEDFEKIAKQIFENKWHLANYFKYLVSYKICRQYELGVMKMRLIFLVLGSYLQCSINV